MQASDVVEMFLMGLLFFIISIKINAASSTSPVISTSMFWLFLLFSSEVSLNSCSTTERRCCTSTIIEWGPSEAQYSGRLLVEHHLDCLHQLNCHCGFLSSNINTDELVVCQECVLLRLIDGRSLIMMRLDLLIQGKKKLG